MPTLKLFFHDHCFDGAASAALFSRFYGEVIAPGAEIELHGLRHTRGDPFAAVAFDADAHACVDFRYAATERLTWWFDHHVSAFQPPELRAHFLARSGHLYYDPEAPSCVGLIARVLAADFGFELDADLVELVHWGEVLDAAQFPDARAALALDEPAPQLAAWLAASQDAAARHAVIRALGRAGLREVVALPDLAPELAAVRAARSVQLELFTRRARLDGEVVYCDLSEDAIETVSGFAGYAVFPVARYAVTILATAQAVKVSVGANPWAARPRSHNLALLCERFGGGGHPYVGGVTLEAGERVLARRIAAQLIAALRAAPA